MNTTIKALFLDIGGVLMTNGWGHELREEIASHFGFDYKAFSQRHTMCFELFETGKISFDEYLNWTIFYEKRAFSLNDVKNYAFNAVRPFQEMLDFVKALKQKYNLKVACLSNEGRELALDRIDRFDLSSFADFFVISAFVRRRKPDPGIYQLAIDLIHVKAEEVCYIDDRALLIESSKRLGLNGIHHVSFEETKKKLEAFNLID
jgi:putative hydrolase of the HAD superfamily